ncbi:hypothetical protein SUGI_0253200 [Cryptomeria japonica]|uniref:uncharacterized protein LOC131076534 n=1 Tax=Cryptomeria japonica TaxID=3369 RepID=UPI002408D42E|nr:uncharacterized protein LOC131076534 [Cryptomeria japonica]GLJ15425.1 hypothetical protein SUGI_0253200 [Cryptomeria japonica]
MGFKITALFLLGFLFISCSLLRAYSQDQIINKALQVDHPAASTTDDSFLPSFGKHKEFGSRKLLLEGEALTEKKVGRSSNDKGGAVKSPEASHVHASKTGSDDELTEKQASSIWTTRAIQVVNAEDQSNLEMNEEQGMRTSLKSFLSSLLKKLHKRASVVKASSKKQMSGRILASKNVIPDSNTKKLSPASPAPPETSHPFNSHSTQSTDDDNGEITRMDYTPAQRKPPIHNESAP